MEKIAYEKPGLVEFQKFKALIVSGASCAGETEDVIPCECAEVSTDVL